LVSKISLIDINLRQIIEHLKKRIGVALPEEIIAVDYDRDADTLGIRFSLNDDVDSYLYDEGKIILGLDRQKNIALIEILSFSKISQHL